VLPAGSSPFPSSLRLDLGSENVIRPDLAFATVRRERPAGNRRRLIGPRTGRVLDPPGATTREQSTTGTP
jgi:hypothetical protein